MAVACTALGLVAVCLGQPKPGPGPSSRPADLRESAVSEDMVQAKLKELEASTALSETDRKTLKETLGQALEALNRAKEHAAKAAGYEQVVKEAPARLAQLRGAASQPTTQPAAGVQPGMSLEQVEARLKQLQLQQADLVKRAGELASELKTRANRHGEIPKAIAATQDRLKQTQEELAKLPASAASQQAKEARRLLLLAQTKSLQAEIDAYQKQMATFDTRGSLMRAQQDVITRQLASIQVQVKVWDAEVASLRKAEAARQLAAAQKAEREAAEKHPLLLALRKKNTGLAEMRAGSGGLNGKQAQVADQLRRVRERLAKIEKSFERVRSMVKEVGETQAIGLLLRQQRHTLPDPKAQEERSATVRREMSDARMRLFDLNELAAELGDVDAKARELVDRAAPPVPSHQQSDILASARKALLDRKELLRPLLDGYESYFNALAEEDTLSKRLLSRAEEFREYIDERVLWIRSTAPLSLSDLSGSRDAMLWLANPVSWAGLLAALRQGALSAANLLVVLGIVVLLLLRRRIRRALTAAGHATADEGLTPVRRTLWALLLTFTLAAMWPLVLTFVGWRVVAIPMGTDLARAVGHGLVLAAGAWLPVAVLLQICRRDGLGETYFRWPAAAVQRLGRSIAWFAGVAVPLVFVFGAMEGQDTAAFRDSLGRLALILLLVLLSLYILWMFRPEGPFLRTVLATKKTGWVFHYRRLWYPVACVVPLSLAAASAAGYHYTTIYLASRLLIQMWVLIGLVLLNAVMANWLLAARRRLARRVMAQRREAAAQTASPQEPGAGSVPPEATAAEIDLSAVSTQTRQFIRYLMGALLVAGVWVIWSGVLTGLGILRQVALWDVTVDGQPAAVTAANLAVAFLVIVVMVLVYRNISGILEITILQRFRVASGVRYAIGHLARYLVAVVGVVWALSEIGVKWGQIQWLVAAMTVGLGFGLQEIFANFISGLILLFERPIRVGDTVTVGETSGTVTRIRIRATTITDWDRKELIVPNKEFVTGRLVNWTLSDKVIRVILKVGIAYGSDTDLAEETLRTVARTHPLVLAEPKPLVLFKEFGNSSLDFELRVHISGIENYMSIWHDLNKAIDREFRKARIEIAFPQRDIHVRSIRAPMPVRAEDIAPSPPPNTSDPPKDVLA